MSTKTVFKRVALIAAVALAIGGISAVAANASNNAILTYAAGDGSPVAPFNTGNGVAGPANTVTLAYVGSATLKGYVTVSGASATILSGGTVASPTVTNLAVGAVTTNIVVATPAVGTITASVYTETGAGTGLFSSTAAETVAITVNATAQNNVFNAAKSTVYGASGLNPPTLLTDGAFSVTAAAATLNVARFEVVELDASGNAVTGAALKPITAYTTIGSITPSIGAAGFVTGAYSTGTPSSNVSDFVLNGIGVAGIATITITVNGVAKTYTVVFTGAAAKIVLTVVNPVVAVGAAATLLGAGITANTNALEVQEFDAIGHLLAVNTGTITVASSNAAIATANTPSIAVGALPVNFLGGIISGTALSTTVAGVSLTGVTAGSATFTATDSLGAVTSLPLTVRVSSGVPTSVVLTTNSNSYSSGGVGTLTTTLSNAAGTLPAGTYLVLSYAGATSSFALTSGTGNLPAASVTVNDAGVYTDTFNAPISDGTVTISAVPAVATITVVPATFTVASSATASIQKAIDAANEATSAAKASTVAAAAAGVLAGQAVQAAKDAGAQATVATAAVAALSVRVTNVLAKIAALSKLILRLIKKAHA